MAFIKCLHKVVPIARDLLKEVFNLKKIHLSIAKTYNHIRFLRRCKKLDVIPKGFFVKLPMVSRNSTTISKSASKALLQDQVNFHFAHQSKLLKEEGILRNKLIKLIPCNDWINIWEYIIFCERKTFDLFRNRQINKINSLLTFEYEQHERSMGLQKAPNNANFINLSTKNITPVLSTALNRGLKLVLTSNKVDKLEVATQVEVSIKKSGEVNHPLPKAIMKCIKNKKLEKDNLTQLERQAIQELRRDENTIVLSSDKGNKMVIMDKVDYEEKLETIIFGSSYLELKKNPTITVDNKIRKIASSLKKLEMAPKNIFHGLVTKYTRDPAIFGNPKIHKEGTPLRPIISSYGTVLEQAAKFCSPIINHYVAELGNNIIIHNSYQFKNKVKSLMLPAENILVSWDVVNLFGSISHKLCMETVTECIEEDKNFEEKFQIPGKTFLQIIDLIISNSFFKYKDVFYAQKLGLPMGSPTSPGLANLTMLKIENKFQNLKNFNNLMAYSRYVDDSGAIWFGDRDSLNVFHKEINELEENIKFTMEVETETGLNYLDMNLMKVDNRIRCKVYNKPISSQQILPFDSFHDYKSKVNIIKGETHRYLNISDEPLIDLKLLKDKFINNGYPENLVHKTMKIAEKIHKVPLDSHKIQTKPNDYLITPYLGSTSSKIRKCCNKYNMNYICKKQNNLGSILSKNYKYKTDLPNAVVYKIKCECGQIYIGETGVALKSRIQRHKYAVKTASEDNGIAVHCCSTGHNMLWEEAEILTREGNWMKRKYSEALWIQKLKPDLNLNEGFSLKGQWDNFL